jgi:hypothetical protein
MRKKGGFIAGSGVASLTDRNLICDFHVTNVNIKNNLLSIFNNYLQEKNY